MPVTQLPVNMTTPARSLVVEKTYAVSKACSFECSDFVDGGRAYRLVAVTRGASAEEVLITWSTKKDLQYTRHITDDPALVATVLERERLIAESKHA